MKFKVGDYVEIIDLVGNPDYAYQKHVGKIGVVYKTECFSVVAPPLVYVELLDGTNLSGLFEWRLALVNLKDPDWTL